MCKVGCLTSVYTSETPGNGKTFSILKRINRGTVSLRNSNVFRQNLQVILLEEEIAENHTEVFQKKKYIQFIIGGDITEDSLQKQLKSYLNDKQQVDCLYIKLNFVERLSSQNYLINDFLFNLCVFKFFWYRGEPHFFQDGLQIFIEVESYPKQFLLQAISVLQMFPTFQQEFSIERLDCHVDDVEHPIQSACLFLQIVLEEEKFEALGLTPHKNFNSVQSFMQKKKKKVKPLSERIVRHLLKKYFVDNSLRKGDLSYSSLMLFCKVVDYEFRNVDSNPYFNDGSIRKKKADMLLLIVQIAVRLTNPSVQAISSQTTTMDRFQKNSDFKKYSSY